MKKSRISKELQDEALALHTYLTNYALKQCGDEDLAKDAVQEAYCQFFEGYDAKRRNCGSVRTFLFSKVKCYIWVERERNGVFDPISPIEFKVGEFDMMFEDIEDLDQQREKAEKEEKSRYRKLNKLLTKRVFRSEKPRVQMYKEIYPLYIKGYSWDQIYNKLGWDCTRNNAEQRILRMREHVSGMFGVPMRVFTQYQCRMA